MGNQSQTPSDPLAAFKGKSLEEIDLQDLVGAIRQSLKADIDGSTKPLSESLGKLTESMGVSNRQTQLKDFYRDFPRAKRPEIIEALNKIASEDGVTDPRVAYKILIGQEKFNAEQSGSGVFGQPEERDSGLSNSSKPGNAFDIEIPNGTAPDDVVDIVMKGMEEGGRRFTDQNEIDPFKMKKKE